MQRAYKTKLRLNNEQEAYFLACAGVARYVYNWALNDRIERYKEGLPTNKFEQKKRFNAIKREIAPWIIEYPYVIVQYAFDDLDAAYKNFFRRVKAGAEKTGFPKFRSRHKDTPRFCLGNGVTVENTRIRLPVIGWATLDERGYIPTSGIKINRAAISYRAGNWYVSVQAEVPDGEKPELDGSIGIDLGVKALATTSDGRVFDNPKTLTKYERKMRRLSKELSRREKGGANFRKTKGKIAKLHRQITDTRSHTLHTVSASVIMEAPERIVLEDLNVKGMQANRKLAKSLADASMGELSRQLEYKAAWIGADVVYADRWYPSTKTCSGCGHVQDMPLSERTYRCGNCGLEIDRDLNAALNLAKYE